MKSHEPETRRTPQTEVHLGIYVADDCGSCNESRRLAELMAGRYPSLSVRIVNLSEPETGIPKQVVAVPTFVLNDEVLHLGNPREAWLLRELEPVTSTK